MGWQTGVPEQEGRYLICGTERWFSSKFSFNSELAKYTPEEDTWDVIDRDEHGISSDFTVTHWMPFPEGPDANNIASQSSTTSQS